MLPIRTPLAAVVFDMDGLLLDTEVLAMQALQRAGDALGLPMPLALCKTLIGVPSDTGRRMLAEHHGPGAPVDRLISSATAHMEAAVQAGELRLKPGATAVIERLRVLGVRTAVATSSDRRKATHHLGAAGLGSVFEAVLTRDDVSRGKPWPELYLAAAQRLDVAPADCLALEDSYNGVRAANAAGMPVVMVPDLLPPTDEMRRLALAIVDDLHAALRIIEARSAGDGT